MNVIADDVAHQIKEGEDQHQHVLVQNAGKGVARSGVLRPGLEPVDKLAEKMFRRLSL